LGRAKHIHSPSRNTRAAKARAARVANRRTRAEKHAGCFSRKKDRSKEKQTAGPPGEEKNGAPGVQLGRKDRQQIPLTCTGSGKTRKDRMKPEDAGTVKRLAAIGKRPEKRASEKTVGSEERQLRANQFPWRQSLTAARQGRSQHRRLTTSEPNEPSLPTENKRAHGRPICQGDKNGKPAAEGPRGDTIFIKAAGGPSAGTELLRVPASGCAFKGEPPVGMGGGLLRSSLRLGATGRRKIRSAWLQ